MLGAPGAQKYVVCNADEGDSGTFSDRMLMEGDPFVLIEGMTIAGLAVGRNSRLHLSALGVSPGQARAASSHCRRPRGGVSRTRISRAAARRFELEVRMGAGAYICGEETSLLESLGRQTRASALQAAAAGHARAVRQAHRDQQRDHVCLGAHHSRSRRRILSALRHGPLARHAAHAARRQYQARGIGGGGLRRDPARDAVRLRRRQLQRPADPRGAGGRSARAPICRRRNSTRRWTTRRSPRSRACSGTAASWPSTTRVDMAAQARYAMEFCAIESCGKCTPCRIGSTRGVEVIDRLVAGENAAKQEAHFARSVRDHDLRVAVRARRLDALPGACPR